MGLHLRPTRGPGPGRSNLPVDHVTHRRPQGLRPLIRSSHHRAALWPAATRRARRGREQCSGLFTEPHPRTDAPDRLNNPAPPAPRVAIDPPTAQASLAEPIPESGSLPGFLQILLKTDLELSTTPQERDEAQARHTAVTTRADARSYINYVLAKAQAAKTQNPQIHHLERPVPSASHASILLPPGTPLPTATFPRTQFLIK
jgi:hypothetical protein